MSWRCARLARSCGELRRVVRSGPRRSFEREGASRDWQTEPNGCENWRAEMAQMPYRPGQEKRALALQAELTRSQTAQLSNQEKCSACWPTPIASTRLDRPPGLRRRRRCRPASALLSRRQATPPAPDKRSSRPIKQNPNSGEWRHGTIDSFGRLGVYCACRPGHVAAGRQHAARRQRLAAAAAELKDGASAEQIRSFRQGENGCAA